MFEQACGKSVSMNILRHAYATHEREGDMPLLAKNTLSMTMGHSLTMNDVYRRL
jgi:integrase